MKIELLQDTQEDGHIIAIINGQQKILRTDKTIAEVLGIPSVRQLESTLPTESPAPKSDSHEPNGETVANSNDLQKQDKVKVVGYIAGLKDASGNELAPRPGVVPGGIYRVEKINQTIITIPDPDHEGESKMEKIINSIEAINDASDRPELVTLLPGEFVLYKKRGPMPVKVMISPKEMTALVATMKEEDVSSAAS